MSKLDCTPYGGCFRPNSFDRGTVVGNYCSIADSVQVFNRNHPLRFISMHPFFYNHRLGIIGEDKVSYTPLEIGHDVWIGHNVIILPNITKIGNGAAIGAGTILTRNVPPYAIVVGTPGKIKGYRFEKDTMKEIESTKWWNREINDIRNSDLENFTT